MRATGSTHWLRLIIAGIGVSAIGVILVFGGFALGLVLGHPLAAFAFPILGVVISLMLAQRASESLEESRPDRFDRPPPTPIATWRLCDPYLSNAGIWRADLGQDSPGADLFEDPERFEEYAGRLIADWSFRCGWPYLGCGIARITPVAAAMNLPSGKPDRRWRTYRVTLDLERPESGTLRIGDRVAEFQLDPAPRDAVGRQALELASIEVKDGSPPPVDAVAARIEPMWDPWLDA